MVNFSIIEFILKVQEFGQWNISIIKHFCFYNINTEENTQYSSPQNCINSMFSMKIIVLHHRNTQKHSYNTQHTIS